MACIILPVRDGLSGLSKGSNPTFHFQVGEVIHNIPVIPLHLHNLNHLCISSFALFCAGYSNDWTPEKVSTG